MYDCILTDECFKARCRIGQPPPEPLRSLYLARGDFAAFQLLIDTKGARCILNPGRSPALSYDLHLPRLRIAVQSPFAAEVYTEGYLPDENGVPTADYLSPAPQTYDGGGYAPAFIVVAVPADATPGQYSIAVDVYLSVGAHGEQSIFSATVPLTVSPVVLPKPHEGHTYVDLWQHNSNIARAFGVELWSDAHFACIEKVVAALTALGQKSITVLASDCPWRGWGCYLLKEHPATLYEYSIVPISKQADGRFRYDFAPLKRYIDLCRAHGIDGDITVYGLMGIWTNMPLFSCDAPTDYPEKVLIRYLDEADGGYRYMTKKQDITAYVRALFDFFKAENCFDKVRIGADEPRDLDAYRESYSFLRAIEPTVQFKMALDTREAVEQFAPQVSDIAASFPCSCACGALLREVQRADPPKRVLWYICNIPDKPNSVLHSELTELHALGFIAHRYGFDGFLRWAFTCWPQEPLRDIRYNNTALPAGDVNFVYPAPNGGLWYSLRYFALKRMLRNRELLYLADRYGHAATAEIALNMVLKNQDPQTYMRSERCTCENIYSTAYSDYHAAVALLLKQLEKEKKLCHRG